ncbi:MAG: hypothetical protein HKN00_04040 [Flavobacteriaceae bacterium]|nr:hypothetical protein [Flavobacteriaceae bacterium]NNK72372.1 hypothetical protein [Flavobacteriaceae bacterium]
MKRILTLFITCSCFITSAQDKPLTGASSNNLGLNAADEALLVASVLDISKISGVFYEFDDIRFGRVPTDGSFLLFDTWKNKGEIFIAGDRLVVSNINYHVDEGKFISQMDNDSTFVYEFKGIDRIVVNKRPFISLYSSKDGGIKVYEVIAETDELSLLKNYYSNVQTGSPNPMLNRARNKIRLKSNYYLMRNGGLVPFNSKKSGIRNMLEPEKAAQLERYVKEKKLSYKKDADLKRMFQYLKML